MATQQHNQAVPPKSPQSAISNKPFLIAPSLLSADFARLGEEVHAVEKAGADWLHVDVMDGHFVPNLTIGAPVVKSLRKVTQLPLDVHLMVTRPERFIKDFVDAGADYLTIHVEASEKVGETLSQIRALGCKAGISLRPRTPVESVFPFLKMVDLILVMTVEPGFGGQSFMHEQVTKIGLLRHELLRQNTKALIEVDGGVTDQTARTLLEADVLVAGSFVFKNDYRSAIQALKGVRC